MHYLAYTILFVSLLLTRSYGRLSADYLGFCMLGASQRRVQAGLLFGLHNSNMASLCFAFRDLADTFFCCSGSIYNSSSH